MRKTMKGGAMECQDQEGNKLPLEEDGTCSGKLVEVEEQM
jgi:hypothetical protein